MATITYLGHASLLIETNGHTLLVDPFISGNEKASSINIDELKPDYILITHGHQDHILDVERIANASGATIISNYEIITHFGNKGLKGYPLNHGGKKEFSFGTLKYVNAIHTSSFPDGSYAGNPGGFVLWNEEGCIYIAGDTALTMDMKLIPMLCPKVDIAVLPIGDNFTMGYEEANLAADFVECNRVLGCHYDTFGYIEIDQTIASDHFTKHGKKLELPNIGEAVKV